MSKVHVYADESHVDDGKYLFIGGVWVNALYAPDLEKELDLIACRHGCGEIKWSKSSSLRSRCYKDFVTHFKANASPLRLKFHCIGIDKHVLDHAKYNGGDAELGFFKFYFTLLFNRMKLGHSYQFMLDQKPCSKHGRVSTLRDKLHGRCVRDHGKFDMVTSLRGVDSKDHRIVQLADLILGATAAKWNGRNLCDRKQQLIAHIETTVGIDLSRETASTAEPMSIWKWRPARK